MLAASVLEPATAAAQAGSPEDLCHQELLRGMAGIKKGRDGQRSRCLKFGNYDDCIDTDSHTVQHENSLRNRVAGPDSACEAALDGGLVLADFGPLSCPSEWNDCDVAVPTIATFEDLADCLVCIEHGYDRFLRSVLGWPRPVPSDPDERRCTRGIGQFTASAAKKAVYETAACARGGTKPFACPVDLSPEGRFGRALAVLEKRAQTCGIEEGESPGALVNLCGGTATDTAGLIDCFQGVAKCLACRGANAALGQAEDCVAASGLADCDGTF